MVHRTKSFSGLEYGEAQVKLLMQQQMGLDGQLTTLGGSFLVDVEDFVSEEKDNLFRQRSANIFMRWKRDHFLLEATSRDDLVAL